MSSDLREPLTIIEKEAKAKDVVANKMITEIVLPSTLRSIGKSGLAGHTRMSGTLTIPRNVETLAEEAFGNMAYDSPAPPAVVFETGSRLRSIGDFAFFSAHLKDFTLPENLETIGSLAFSYVRFSFSTDFSSPGTLIIPSKVSRIGEQAFMFSQGITTVDIRSDRLIKPDDGDFPLEDELFRVVRGLTEIKLPQTVYNSYTKAQLQAIFGTAFTNYRKPDGTPYDFASKP